MEALTIKDFVLCYAMCKRKQSLDWKEKQILLTEYKVASNFALAASEGNWRKFQIFLIMNTILISVSAAISMEAFKQGVSTVGLIVLFLISIVGIVFVITGFAAWARTDVYHRYWFIRLREIEEKLKPLKMFTEGHKLAEGEDIYYDEDREVLKMRGLAKIRARHTLLVAIITLGVIWAGVFFVALGFLIVKSGVYSCI